MSENKIPFIKLGLKENNDIVDFEFNKQKIEVKKYISTSEIIQLITNVFNNSEDDNGVYSNPIKTDILLNLEIVYAYTNIDFTQKQKEDPLKLYDLLNQNGILNEVLSRINQGQRTKIKEWLLQIKDSYYKYKNSAMGIMEQISQDYSNMNFDATEIQKKIADPDNLTLLKDVVNKLG